MDSGADGRGQPSTTRPRSPRGLAALLELLLADGNPAWGERFLALAEHWPRDPRSSESATHMQYVELLAGRQAASRPGDLSTLIDVVSRAAEDRLPLELVEANRRRVSVWLARRDAQLERSALERLMRDARIGGEVEDALRRLRAGERVFVYGTGVCARAVAVLAALEGLRLEAEEDVHGGDVIAGIYYRVVGGRALTMHSPTTQ